MPLSQFLFCIKLNSWLIIPSLYMVIPFILGVFARQYRQTLTYSPTAGCNQNVLLSLSFHSQQTGEEHEEGEPEQRIQVPPPGTPHPAKAAGHVLHLVPGGVPDHGAGQPAHHSAHQARPSPPHPHVLLPQSLGPH